MWNLLSQRLSRRTASNGRLPDAEADRDPLDDLVREAFPRPTASSALHDRVAALTPAPARAASPWRGRAPRFALAAAMGGLVLTAALSTGRKSGVAYADDAPTAGSLAIVDKQGNVKSLCPLKHTDVKADISGYVSRVTVSQEFRNPGSDPIEAVYTFPLPSEAAVDDMTMVLGDRIIKGQIKRKEEARQIYEDARTNGQAAALLDQERPNIFTQQVANIMPGQAVTVTISYVNMLKYGDGAYEWSFPMVVGPRFTTGSSGYQAPGVRGNPSTAKQIEGDPGAVSVETDAEKITPPIAPANERAGHNISLSVNLDAGVPIGDIESVQHGVVTQRTGETRAALRLRDQKSIPNKDFILRFRPAGAEINTGLLAHAPEAGKPGYFTLIVQPPANPAPAQVSAKEMVFVIDQTGSQSGEPIKKAKELMRYCIKQLNADDSFQLLGFNTDIFPCFSASVKNTPANVKRALDYLDSIEAGGGTDILKSIDYALKMPDDPARLRMICYLTDGYVGNDMQILGYVREHRGRARVFPVGIGSSVNRFLIEGMGREGRGASEVLTLDEDVKAMAKRFYDRISQPLLLDPSVDWGGLPVADVYPKAIPDVFSSGPIILKGRYLRAANGEITVSGRLRGQPWSTKVRVSLPAQDAANSAIPTLWAREKIEDLQSQNWLGQQLGRPNSSIQQQIVGLALDYRLMTQQTSFVAVEQRKVNIGGRVRTVDVPVEMPEGVSHEGIFGAEERDADALTTAGRRWFKGKNASINGMPPTSLHQSRRFQMGGTYLRSYKIEAARTRPAYAYAAPGAAGAAIPPPSIVAAPAPKDAAPSRAASESAGSAQSSELSAFAMEQELQIGDRSHIGRAAGAVRMREAKLAPELRAAAPKRTIEIQIWLEKMPANGLELLKAQGFTFAETLMPGKLVLGSIASDKLRELAKLPWVKRIELANLH